MYKRQLLFSDDDIITEVELEDFFENSFGDKQWGSRMFNAVDVANDGFITMMEWESFFFALDSQST